MADEQKPQDTEDTRKREGGRRLPIWIGVIIAVEMIAALAIVQTLLPSRESDTPNAWLDSAEAIERDIPSVIVNLKDGNAKRLLRIHLIFRVLAEKPAAAEAAINRTGVIEDRLIELLSKKRLCDVTGRQAEIKSEIAEMLRNEVFTKAWRKKHGEVKIDELLMPEFVIQ